MNSFYLNNECKASYGDNILVDPILTRMPQFFVASQIEFASCPLMPPMTNTIKWSQSSGCLLTVLIILLKKNNL